MAIIEWFIRYHAFQVDVKYDLCQHSVCQNSIESNLTSSDHIKQEVKALVAEICACSILMVDCHVIACKGSLIFKSSSYLRFF